MLRCLLLALLVSASTATARTEKSLAYARDAAWPTAVRFIRVDEGLKIIEKDAEAGYVLFELKEEGKTFRGALEVVTIVVDGRTLVKFVLQIDERPSWMEIAMLTRLERKLRAELGSPAPAPTKKPKDEPKPEKPPADDGGVKISPTP